MGLVVADRAARRGSTTRAGLRPAAASAGSSASARRWAPRSSSTSGLWGVMFASSKGDRQLPADTESRIAAFTELVATAISNTEARAEVAAARRRAGRAAARRDAGRARVAAGRGVRRGRRGGRPAAAGRGLDEAVPLRGRRHGDRSWRAGAHGETRSRSARAGHSRATNVPTLVVETRPARPDRRLRRRAGPLGALARDARASARAVGDADRRRGPAVGRADRRIAARRAAAGRHRVAHRRVHRARRHRDLERPGARRSSRRRGRGSWRRPTRSAGGWFATCTTERSSAWSTRSSR